MKLSRFASSGNVRHSSVTCDEHYHGPCASTIGRPRNWFSAFHSQISCGGSSAVSIHRRHVPAARLNVGSSKSRGSQYAFRMMCANTASFFDSPADCEAVRERRPVRLIEFHAMPGLYRLAKHLAQTRSAAFMFDVAQQAPLNQQLHKPEDIRMLRRAGSSRTNSSRCPGSRRCCFRAGYASPHRP